MVAIDSWHAFVRLCLIVQRQWHRQRILAASAKTDALGLEVSGAMSCFMQRARRSSFQTPRVLPFLMSSIAAASCGRSRCAAEAFPEHLLAAGRLQRVELGSFLLGARMA